MYPKFMENIVIWVNFLLCNVNTVLVARDQIIANLKHAHLNTKKAYSMYNPLKKSFHKS